MTFFSSLTELVPESDEISNAIYEDVDSVRQINLDVDSDDIQEMLDSHNRKLTMYERMKKSKT